jgi:hypothetical protein
MPRLLPLIAVLVLSSGCRTIYRAVVGDDRAVPVRALASQSLGCNEQELQVEERDTFFDMQWLVTGCGRSVACGDVDDQLRCFANPPKLSDFGGERLPDAFLSAAESVAEATGCSKLDARSTRHGEAQILSTSLCDRDFVCEFGRRNNAECHEVSVERTMRKVVLDRLGLETGCPTENIEFANQAAWVRGTEHAYRLTACGKAYVCTTASGRTDCKAALAAQAPE